MSLTVPATAAPTLSTERLSKARLWTARVLSYLPAAFLLVDGGMKLAKPDFIVKATAEMNYPTSAILPLGILLTTSTILYLIPRTAVLGAILITAYLGGAISFHVERSNPLFSHTLFPLFLAIPLWLGLTLRNPKLAQVLFNNR